MTGESEERRRVLQRRRLIILVQLPCLVSSGCCKPWAPRGSHLPASAPGRCSLPHAWSSSRLGEAQEFCESQKRHAGHHGPALRCLGRGLDRVLRWLAVRPAALATCRHAPRPPVGTSRRENSPLCPSQTGLLDPLSRHHAFCFRGLCPHVPPGPPLSWG